jgi:MFS family permease
MLTGAIGGLLLLPVRLDAPPYFFALAAGASGIYALRIKPAPSPAPPTPIGDGLIQPPGKVSQVGTGLIIVNFLNSAGLLPIASFLTFYVAKTVFPTSATTGANAVLIALANAPQVILLAFVAPYLARFGDRIGRLRPLALSVVANLPISLALVFIRELWHLAFFGLLFAVAGVIFSTSLNSIVGDVYRTRRGFAYGGLNTAFSLGAALGSALGGVLFPLGWSTLIVTSVLIQATALLGVVMIGRGYRATLGPAMVEASVAC